MTTNPTTAAADIIDLDADPAPAGPMGLAPMGVPATLNELASRKRESVAIIDARVGILKNVRAHALRATWPQDWVLFKADDGLVVAFLEDSGCDRVRPYYGIEIRDVSDPRKIVGEAGAFYYVVTASGVCKLTGEVLEAVEGGRASTEEFVKHVADPMQKDLLVRKAARASADGIVVRTLAGLQSVPLEELREAWTDTGKHADECRKGRGYGTRTERLGGVRESDPNVAPPVCPHCHAAGKYRPARGDRSAFYGCPNYEKHPHQKWIVDAAEWVAQQQKATAASTRATSAPLTADEVFGRGPSREPGADG